MSRVHESTATAWSLLDLLFDDDLVGRCLVAPDGRILRANAKWLRSTGLRSDEAVGQNFIELFPETRDMALALHARARAGERVEVPRHARVVNGRRTWWKGTIDPVPMGGGTELLITAREASGEYRWFGDGRELARDDAGRGGALVQASGDVTEQRRIEEELRNSELRFRVLADGTPTMIWSTDATGRILFVNRAYCEFFGVTPEGVCASGWQPLVHPEDAPGYVEAYLAALAKRAPFHAEARVRRADGQWRWIESFAQPQLDADGNLVSMTGSSPDVTDRKRAEEALQQADRQKTEFLAVLSHELRNPLAPIRNAILLLDRAAPESATAKRSKEILRRQADQLARLVDDLLDLSRITYGKLHVELAPADARELVRLAYADAKLLFEQREVDLALFDAADPLWIEADPPRFAQMLGNLLHNALKFTSPGGLVQFRVSRLGTACEISVKDDGQGLSGADLQRIFDPFEQGSLPRASAGGLGLGLALVKRIAEKHRATVSARSNGPGKGAEFVIEVPLTEAVVVGATEHGHARRSGVPPMRVLVVEDNEDAAATLSDLLSLGGHAVETVSTGAAGVRAVERDAPEVLICDIGLPDMSGYDVIRAVRSGEKDRRVFAVALTGYAQPRDRDEALAAGFDAHLPKPPPFDELEALLRTVVPPADSPDRGKQNPRNLSAPGVRNDGV